MNAIGSVPVDLLPWIWAKRHGAAGHDPQHAYLRVVPTADLSITMGAVAVAVLFLCIYYNVKIKGVGGICTSGSVAPFGTTRSPRIRSPGSALLLPSRTSR